MDWNSIVWRMKIKVMKDEYEALSMKLVYDGKPLASGAQWYTTCILGKEDVTLHLCKR